MSVNKAGAQSRRCSRECHCSIVFRAAAVARSAVRPTSFGDAVCSPLLDNSLTHIFNYSLHSADSRMEHGQVQKVESRLQHEKYLGVEMIGGRHILWQLSLSIVLTCRKFSFLSQEFYF